MPECRSAGVLECRSAGVLECWSAGVLECWSIGVPECKFPPNSPYPHTPIPPYPHTPELRHPGTPALRHSQTPSLRHSHTLIILLILLFCFSPYASAQPDMTPKKPQKAFALSLVVPGWGHKYAQNGSWRGMATVYAGVDVGLWAGLINSIWRRNHLTQSFETLAATRAAADISGKDRAFYLNLATYMSSNEFLESQLRNRAWDRVDYVSDPSFQWVWESEEDFLAFRELREDAETFRRRRSLFIAALVANRLLSGLGSIGAANKSNASFSVSMGPPPVYGKVPVVNVGVSF